MNRKEIIELMQIAADEFGGLFNVTEARVTLWHDQLSAYELPDAKSAMIAFIGLGTGRPPDFGQLRKLIIEARVRKAREVEPIKPVEISDEQRAKNLAMLRDCIKGLASRKSIPEGEQ